MCSCGKCSIVPTPLQSEPIQTGKRISCPWETSLARKRVVAQTNEATERAKFQSPSFRLERALASLLYKQILPQRLPKPTTCRTVRPVQSLCETAVMVDQSEATAQCSALLQPHTTPPSRYSRRKSQSTKRGAGQALATLWDGLGGCSK